MHPYIAILHQRAVKWTKLDANGGTPLGQALTLCTEAIQQLTPDKFNGKPYRPTIVLVSDGEPTDDFNTVLDRFLANKKRAHVIDGH